MLRETTCRRGGRQGKTAPLPAMLCLLVVGNLCRANPIPWPPPACMPLEDMRVRIEREGDGFRASFSGDFTFTYIPEEVTAMCFPVPVDAFDGRVYQGGDELAWHWSAESYPTVLPEMPSLPMLEWDGPFPLDGDVFGVEYRHELIERGDQFVFLYSLGTGKYFPTYDKITTAVFDISLSAGLTVEGLWLDKTPVAPEHYQIEGTHVALTLESWFGPFTRDLIIILRQGPLPLPDANCDSLVDDDDLSLLLAHWGQHVGHDRGDFNGDSIVDDVDLSYLLTHWSAFGGQVPEPATATLLISGAWCLTRRRRRRR